MSENDENVKKDTCAAGAASSAAPTGLQPSSEEEQKRAEAEKQKKWDTIREALDASITTAFGAKKVWTKEAKRKLKARLATYSVAKLCEAFANLPNEPDRWKIEHNGFRPLSWWLHSDDRIESMLHCHEKRATGGAKQVVVSKSGNLSF